METPPNLGNRAPDYVAASLKGLLGIVPGVGSILAETAGTIIPNQRIDRLAEYTMRLANTINPSTATAADGPRSNGAFPKGKLGRALELPLPDFVGRELELTELDSQMESGGVILAAVRGMGGIGKTQLARMLAKRWRAKHDVALEINLHGASPSAALNPGEIIVELIRAVSPEAARQVDDEAAETTLSDLWQDLLRKQRFLLLLDNARDALQVQDVLPKSEGHTVIITSRTRFTLPGLRSFDLSAMRASEAEQMLRRIAPHLDESTATKLAHECGHLPLALRLVGSYLANRASLSADRYISDLRERRIAILNQAAEECGESTITATLSLSYDSAGPELRACWRRLAVFPGSFDAAAAIAVGTSEEPGADEKGVHHTLITELHRLNLIDWNSVEQTYCLHDLCRDVARTYLNEDEVEAFAARLNHARFYEALLFKLDHDAFTTNGVLSRPVLATFQREIGNIVAGWEWCLEEAGKSRMVAEIVAGYCANTGELMAAFMATDYREQLYARSVPVIDGTRTPRPLLMARFLSARATYDRGEQVGTLEAAETFASIAREARASAPEIAIGAWIYHGRYMHRAGKNREAIREQQLALDVARSLGEPVILIKTLTQLARTHLNCSELGVAERLNDEACRLAERGGLQQYLATCLVSSARIAARRAADAAAEGNMAQQRTLMDQSVELAQRALDETRKVGSLKLINNALFSLGRELRHRQDNGDLPRAMACFEESLQLTEMLGNIRGQAGACLDIGEVFRLQKRPDDALRFLTRSLELQKRTGYDVGEASTRGALIKILINRDPRAVEDHLEHCRRIYHMPKMQRYRLRWENLERWVAKHRRKDR